jgi:hypothetical protein
MWVCVRIVAERNIYERVFTQFIYAIGTHSAGFFVYLAIFL